MLALSTALLSFAPPTFSTPTIEIAPGVHLPLVGIGTWQYNEVRTDSVAGMALRHLPCSLHSLYRPHVLALPGEPYA